MGIPFDDIASDPDYQALPPDRQQAVRQGYFDTAVRPYVPPEIQDDVQKQFEDYAAKAKDKYVPGIMGSLSAGVGQRIKEGSHVGEALNKSMTPTDLTPPNIRAARDIEITAPWNADLESAAEKLTYGLGHSFPSLAAGLTAGAVAGGTTTAMMGGPENPVADATGAAVGLGAGALAAGAASAAYDLAPIYSAELKKTPTDPQGAYDRAIQQASISGVSSSVGWAMFGWAPFKNKVADTLFQAFGVQPAVGETAHAATNLSQGQPAMQGAGEHYGEEVAGTLVPLIGQHAVGMMMPGKGEAKPKPINEHPPAEGAPPAAQSSPAASPQNPQAKPTGSEPVPGYAEQDENGQWTYYNDDHTPLTQPMPTQNRAENEGERQISLQQAREKPAEKTEIDEAAAVADTNPSDTQKASGNYRKGHVDVQGIPVTIETPKGAERKWTNPETGESGTTEVQDHYGDIKGSKGADGDHVDTYVGDHPESPEAFIIDQVDPKTGEFDEHKVMLGYENETRAAEAYRHGFSDGSGDERMGDITPIPTAEVKEWAQTADTTKPAAETVSPIAPKRKAPLPPLEDHARLLHEDTAYLPNGKSVPVQYALVEADKLVTSHDDALR